MRFSKSYVLRSLITELFKRHKKTVLIKTVQLIKQSLLISKPVNGIMSQLQILINESFNGKFGGKILASTLIFYPQCYLFNELITFQECTISLVKILLVFIFVGSEKNSLMTTVSSLKLGYILKICTRFKNITQKNTKNVMKKYKLDF